MSVRLRASAVVLSGCLVIGCGSGDASSEREATDPNAAGAANAANFAGAANAAGSASAAGAENAAAGAGGAPSARGGAGAGGDAVGGGKAGVPAAGRTGEGGSGGGAFAGAAGHAGGAGGRAGAGGHAEGGGGLTGSAGHGAGHGGFGGLAGAGAGGGAGLGPEAPGGRISGYGTVVFQVGARNQIVRLQTRMVVPPEPPPSGTLFLWPGLQPDGANFDPIDNGVLQPVLTWGDSCSPGKQPRTYSTWWISGQYVNTYGNDPGYTGCLGGPIMSVGVGDTLAMDIALDGTVWTQTVTDEQTGEEVTFSIDMQGQAQNLAYFVIEEYSSAPVSEVIFTDNVITFGSADAADCKLTGRGQSDYVSVPVPSSDGLTCSIAEIILRAQGID